MVEGAKNFLPHNNSVYNDLRSNIILEDARTYFANAKNKYDIISSEPSTPGLVEYQISLLLSSIGI